MGMDGMGAVISSLGGALGALSTDYDAQYASIGNPTDTIARIQSMDAITNRFMQQNNIFEEQKTAIARTLGDMMSQRGRQAIQAQSQVMAAGAVSGTSGGTTQVASYQAYVDAELDKTIMISDGKASKLEVSRKQMYALMDTGNQLTGQVGRSQVIDVSGGSDLMAGISGALNGFTGAMGSLSDNSRTKIYNKIDTWFKG